MVVGSRIHGVNLGWQTGRAALVVSFDLRTEELADTMGVPWVKAADMPVGQDAKAFLCDRVFAASESYDRRRADLAARLATVLERSGLLVSAGLRDLAQQPQATPAGIVPASLAAREVPTEEVQGGGNSVQQCWGFLETYSTRRIAGWVQTNGGTMPELDIRLDGLSVGSIVPNVTRTDLGSNARGFEFTPPADAFPRPVMQLEVCFAKSGRHLKNSPIRTGFQSGDDAKVLRGRSDYLFLQNDLNNVLRQITGERALMNGK